jgi:guanylate kinase
VSSQNLKQGKVIIFSAPSGAGKTTIVRALLDKKSELSFSISACSRDPRGQELNGKDYHFIGIEAFRSKIKNNEFAEWEEVYENHFYGTLNSELTRIWNANKTVVFDVDVVGGLNLKNKFGKNALAIFVMPPSLKILEQRLRNRNTDSEQKIRQRLAKAEEEISLSSGFDIVLENDDLDKAVFEANAIVNEFLVS